MGATGAGKTSVVSLIARFYDPQRGCVFLDGVDVRRYRQEELRRHVGIVLQEPFLFSGTVLDNLRLFDPSVPPERVEEVSRFLGAHEFILRLPKGYQTVLGERGAGLSTGEKQLLALVRALLASPDILLILDEATASVDSETEKRLQEALYKAMEGRTSSSSPTASPPSATWTASSSSARGGSWRRGATRSFWPRAATTPPCTGSSSRRRE